MGLGGEPVGCFVRLRRRQTAVNMALLCAVVCYCYFLEKRASLLMVGFPEKSVPLLTLGSSPHISTLS